MTRIDRCTSLERLNHSSKKLTRHGRISIQVSVYSVGQLSVAANNSYMTYRHYPVIYQFKVNGIQTFF